MAKRARQEENTHEKELVKINAGGKIYYTTQKTLTANFPNSMIATLFSRKSMIDKDDDGVYFLDVDQTLFGAMLNVMRRPSLVDVVPQGIAEEIWWYELDYWGLREYTEMTVELKPQIALMPDSLGQKLKLLEENEQAAQRRMKQIDFVLIDHLLEWLNIGQYLLCTSPMVSSYVWIPENILHVNTADATIGPKPTDTKIHSICAAHYLYHFRETYIKMLKELCKLTGVLITRKVPPGAYNFEGVDYQVVAKKEVLYISIQKEYYL